MAEELLQVVPLVRDELRGRDRGPRGLEIVACHLGVLSRLVTAARAAVPWLGIGLGLGLGLGSGTRLGSGSGLGSGLG